MDEKVEAFMNSLSEIAYEDEFEKGYYGHFELGDEFELHQKPEEEYWAGFLLRTTGQLIQIRKTVNQFRNNYSDQITIKLWTSEGEEI